MSKLRPNKINFDDDDFVVEFEKEIQQDFVTFGIEENTEPEIKELTPQELEIIEKNEELEQLKKEIENYRKCTKRSTRDYFKSKRRRQKPKRWNYRKCTKRSTRDYRKV